MKAGPGRPKMSTEEHLGQDITRTEIKGIFARLLRMNVLQLETILLDKTQPAHDLVVARIIAEAIRQGDPRRLDFLYDRLVGKAEDPNADRVVGSLNRLIVAAMARREQEAAGGERPVEALPDPGVEDDIGE